MRKLLGSIGVLAAAGGAAALIFSMTAGAVGPLGPGCYPGAEIVTGGNTNAHAAYDGTVGKMEWERDWSGHPTLDGRAGSAVVHVNWTASAAGLAGSLSFDVKIGARSGHFVSDCITEGGIDNGAGSEDAIAESEFEGSFFGSLTGFEDIPAVASVELGKQTGSSKVWVHINFQQGTTCNESPQKEWGGVNEELVAFTSPQHFEKSADSGGRVADLGCGF